MIFSVDSEQVLAATAAARGTADRLEAEASAMLAQLTQLQGSWTGVAAAAFQDVIDQWRVTQRHVEASLAAISHALAAAGRQYADTEQAAVGLFR
jgi:WXG100 family type VII secretion target